MNYQHARMVRMHVFVTFKFENNQINSNSEILETSTFRHPRVANSIVSDPIWPKSELMQNTMHAFVAINFKEARNNSNQEQKWRRVDFFRRLG